MLRLTRTGKIFVAVIVVMHFASITSRSGLLIWLVGLIAACLIVNAFAAMRAVRIVRLRAPMRTFIEQGAAAREPWQFSNSGKRTARLITVELANREVARAAEIGADQTINVAPLDVFRDRGVYAMEDAWIVSLFPFGLVKAMRAVDCSGEILVYPKLRAAKAPEVRGLDPMLGGRVTGQRRVSVGETFAGVRPLQAGDSFKQIHWRSSAKAGGLMVKTFEEQLAGRAALLVFCAKPGTATEACLREAGSMALAGLEAGHQIEFCNLNEDRRLRLEPFGDATRLLEELARFDPRPPAKAFHEMTRTIRPRVALHFVVSELTEPFAHEIDRLIAEGKRVFVHAPEGVTGRLDWELLPFKLE